MHNDMKCPYCGAGQKVFHDDGHGLEEDTPHEHGCRECGKYFVFHTTINYDYEPRKADCLNNGEHQLKMSNTYPRRHSRMRCKDCGFSRSPTPEEFAAHGIDLIKD
jgi:rubredoxin